MDKRYFTLEEANRTLPLVRRIVQDIVDEYGEWKGALGRYEAVAGRDQGNIGESEEAAALRTEVDEIAQRINEFIEELKQIGCVLKGFDDGLVDFHSTVDDRDIFLCWRLGETEVSHWHEIDTGFAARRSVVPEVVGEVPDP